MESIKEVLDGDLLRQEISYSIPLSVGIPNLPKVPQAKRKEDGPRGIGIKFLSFQASPSRSPVVGAKPRGLNVQRSFISLYEGFPEQLCIITSKEDMVLVFRLVTADMAVSLQVQTPRGKGYLRGKAVMVQKPHKSFDLVGVLHLPDPVEGIVGFVMSHYQVRNVVINTFTGEGAISFESPEGSVLRKVAAVVKGILHIEDNLGGILKVSREDYFRFVNVNSLARVRAEIKEDSVNGVAILGISLRKKLSNIFLDNNGIIRSPPFSHEASLVGADDFFQMGLDPRGDDFVLCVTQSNRVIVPVTTFIHEGIDPISPSSIESGSVKESGIRIPFKKPRDSRLKFPEFCFKVEDIVEVLQESLL
ncbi:hypothetical protein FXO38_32939 [Capsicum annuum]|nr:hypothetical protein FXO38_32939 [Capsicum annuum]